ncbi:MAG TPA: CPBP family intramembrane glutamic endopeptidase [Pseudolabrys sp.]|nr:CPBP family intramembrane glutamic endopeptidase [Pseudolabrys sp.]
MDPRSEPTNDQATNGAVKPWGRFSTLGLGFIALLIGQMAALVALAAWYGRPLTQLPNLAQDGVAVSLLIWISTPVQVGILMLMSRQTGATARDYLALKMPRKAEVIVGILVMIAFIIIGNLVSWLLGQNIVTPFQFDIYRTAYAAGWLPVLWLAVAVVTPIGEETLFRGFLFRGWHKSPRDVWLVIAATSALWAMSHLQYDLFVIAQIFVVGLILGWFRWVTGSTLLTILLHGLVNCEGMFETFLALHK